MQTRALFPAILIACFAVALSCPCPSNAWGPSDQAMVVPSQSGGDNSDAPLRPLRKAVLGNENDLEREDSGRPPSVLEERLASGSPRSAGLVSRLGPHFPAGLGTYSAPLYLALRTLLI